MGILEHFSHPQNCIKSTNKIPQYAREYKKEYLFIRGINKEFKYFIDKLDDLNNGLFESHRANRIKYFMKRFLRGQEKGKLRDISELEIDEKDVNNLIFIKDKFRCYKIRYDYFYDDDDNDYFYNDDDDDDDDDDEDNSSNDVYPGFKDTYDVFELFYSRIKIKHEDSDSDSDCDCDSDFEIVLPVSDSDSDSDSECDSDSV